MADLDPRIEIKPSTPLTHQELLIDFLEWPPDSEVLVNVAGPISQPYWTTLKTDGTGHAQLFWRTQAPGDFKVRGTADKLKQTAEFSVSRQPGELYDERPDADVKTVEPGPGSETSTAAHDPSLSPEQDDPAFKPAGAPKPRARRKTKKG